MVAQFIDELKADRRLGASLQSPSVSYGSTNLYMRGPLEEATRGNLSRPLSELVDGSGSVVQVRACFGETCTPGQVSKTSLPAAAHVKSCIAHTAARVRVG